MSAAQEVPGALLSSPEAVLAALVGIAAFWFWLQHRTGWKVFDVFPPLIFIYATPVILANLPVLGLGERAALPGSSPVYDALKAFGLPFFIALMLIGIDVGAAFRVMGRGVLVMLLGSVGIVVGGVVSYAVFHRFLAEDAWKGFGALAGSWIGGTGNMGAVAGALEAEGSPQLGLAVLADNVVYVVWLPLLLGSKAFADRFNAWARVPADRLERMEAAAALESREEARAEMRDLLYLGALAALVTWAGSVLAPLLPELGPVVSTSTWKVLLITTLSIGLSLTPARRLPGSQEIAMAVVYVYVAQMGARANLDGLADAPAFLAAAFLWIAIHGAFTLAGARLLRIDVHSAAIASAANVGGAASAPVVAAAHRESLVPVSILMALIGYALGTYLATLTAVLCEWVGS